MSRFRMILALVALGSMAGALPASAQKPSDNRYTRGIALYIKQANEAPNPEDKARLYEQAIELAQEGLADDQSNPRLYMLVGQAYAATRRTDEAAEAWERAIELYPEYEEELERDRHNAWVRSFNAAVQASQQGDMEAAEQHYRAADRVYQGRPEAKLNLGTLLASQNRHEDAIPFFEGALVLMEEQAEDEEMTEAARETLETNRRAAVFNLAQVLAGADRHEEAVGHYQAYLEDNPDDMTALGNLGVVLTQLGRGDEVAELYANALERDDLTADEYFRLGVGLFGAERYEESKTAFEKSLEANPHSRDTRFNLANAAYALAREIEDGLAASGESIEGENRENLLAYYTVVREQATALREMDPQNEGVLALAAQAARSLGAINEDEALQQEAVSIIEARTALAFTLDRIEMELDGQSAIVTGTVQNLSADAGTPVVLRVIVVDESGAELGSSEATVPLPEVDGSARFEVEVPVGEDAAPGGWRYEIAG